MVIQISFAEYFQDMSLHTQAEFSHLLCIHQDVLSAVQMSNAAWLAELDEDEQERINASCHYSLLH